MNTFVTITSIADMTTRELAYAFLQLPWHVRVEIGVTLGLLGDALDEHIDITIFRNARLQDKVAELTAAVQQQHHEPES
jgi:hypothetical protein